MRITAMPMKHPSILFWISLSPYKSPRGYFAQRRLPSDTKKLCLILIFITSYARNSVVSILGAISYSFPTELIPLLHFRSAYSPGALMVVQKENSRISFRHDWSISHHLHRTRRSAYYVHRGSPLHLLILPGLYTTLGAFGHFHGGRTHHTYKCS